MSYIDLYIMKNLTFSPRFSRWLLSLPKLLTILRFADYAVFSAFIVTGYMFYDNQQTIASRAANLYQSNLLANELKQTSNDLTRMVRSYAITGNEGFRQQYFV